MSTLKTRQQRRINLRQLSEAIADRLAGKSVLIEGSSYNIGLDNESGNAKLFPPLGMPNTRIQVRTWQELDLITRGLMEDAAAI